MQERRSLFNYLSENDIPSSAQGITGPIQMGSILAQNINTVYLPIFALVYRSGYTPYYYNPFGSVANKFIMNAISNTYTKHILINGICIKNVSSTLNPCFYYENPTKLSTNNVPFQYISTAGSSRTDFIVFGLYNYQTSSTPSIQPLTISPHVQSEKIIPVQSGSYPVAFLGYIKLQIVNPSTSTLISFDLSCSSDSYRSTHNVFTCDEYNEYYKIYVDTE